MDERAPNLILQPDGDESIEHLPRNSACSPHPRYYACRINGKEQECVIHEHVLYVHVKC